MEKIVSLHSLDMYKQVSSLVDGIVLGCDYSFYSNHRFSKEEILSLVSLASKDKKKVFLLTNLVMHNEYKDKVREFISSFKDVDISFIYQDLGIYQILKELDMTERGIYNPLTMITNYEDLLMYDSLGVDAVGLSSEITLDDVKICAEKSSKVFYLGFGYHPMYQTYRKIASLYKEYSGLDYSLEDMAIKELSKKEVNPMVENEFGALVFRCGVISILEEIEKVKDVKYLYLDGIFLNEEVQVNVYKIYSNVIDGIMTKEEGLKALEKEELSYSNRFMNQDSVYNPEDF
jgi:collagenase-like PrtC family protease